MYNEMEYIYDELDALLAHSDELSTIEDDSLQGFSIQTESIYA